jgi:hypothetical protein
MISYRRSHFLGGWEGEGSYLNFIKIKHNYNAVSMPGEEAAGGGGVGEGHNYNALLDFSCKENITIFNVSISRSAF